MKISILRGKNFWGLHSRPLLR